MAIDESKPPPEPETMAAKVNARTLELLTKAEEDAADLRERLAEAERDAATYAAQAADAMTRLQEAGAARQEAERERDAERAHANEWLAQKHDAERERDEARAECARLRSAIVARRNREDHPRETTSDRPSHP